MASLFRKKKSKRPQQQRRSASIATTSGSSIYSHHQRRRAAQQQAADMDLITKPQTGGTYDHDLATKFGDNVMVNDLELLLSMETQARMDALEAREEQLRNRTTTLKFDLPPTPRSVVIADPPSIPTRPSSAPTPPTKGWRRKMWAPAPPSRQRNSASTTSASTGGGSTASSPASSVCSDKHDDDNASIPPLTLELGSKVRLLRRPLPTYGHVRFIGTVDFAPGPEWIGVELNSRVGKNDGAVKGKRYFQTDRDRGLFCLREDLAVVEA